MRHKQWWTKQKEPSSLTYTPVITAFAGLLVGVSQILMPWIERDVRHQVYEATHLEKQRVIDAQTGLLALQESHAEKVRNLVLAQNDLEVAQRELESERSKAEAATQELLLVEKRVIRRYQHLITADKSKREDAVRHREILDKIKPWSRHNCRTESVDTNKCFHGYRSVFATGTIDEHVTAEVSDRCFSRNEVLNPDYNDASESCDVYLRSFFASRGFTAGEISTIESQHLVERFNHLFNGNQK